MKRASVGAVLFSAVELLLVSVPVCLASAKTQAATTDHQFHFSAASKTATIFKNDVHHRAANADLMQAPRPAAISQKRQAQTGLNSRANATPRRYTANPPIGKLGLISASQVVTGGGTYWDAAKGDFNGDGNQDLVTIVQTDNSGTYGYALSILLGNGDGTFQSPKLTTITDNCAVFAVGDVNGDKKDDILLIHVAGQCSNTSSSFDVFTSNGDGTLTKGINYAISPNPVMGGGLYINTNSGHLDLVAVDLPENSSGTPTGPSDVVTVLGNGDGTFSASPASVTLSGQVRGPVVADLNGDGIVDVAGIDFNSNEVTVYLAKSGSAYAGGVAYNTSDGVWDACNLTVGDLNGDGYPEIVTPNCYDENVTIFMNNKDGSYQLGAYYNVAVGGSGSAAAADYLSPAAVAIADVNGDGKPDLIVTNDESADVTILNGNGNGTVNVPTVGYATGGYPQTAAVVADFNGDGHPDLVLANDEFNLVLLKGYGDGTFRAALDYYAPIGNGYYGQSKGIATGDFNGDGVADFVVAGVNNISGLGGVNVFLSRSDGSLQPAVTYGSSSCDYFVAVADFNKDGKLDFVTTDCSANVQLFIGNGDGTFTAGNIFASGGSSPSDLVAADFDGDGYPDVAVINYNGSSNSSVGVLLNDKTGNLQSAVTYTLSGLTTQGIAAADVNGDSKTDLIVPLNNGSAVSILLGNGDGTFQAEQDVSLGVNYPAAATVADVNGDGIQDLIVTLDDGGGDDIAILLGTNPWGYQAPTYLASSLQDYNLNSPYPQYLKVVDIDGDGKPDLVYTNPNYGTVGILFGTGSGSFYDPVEYPAGENPWGLAVADVNGDGTPDVVTASENFAGVTVLLNANGNAIAGDYTVTPNSNSATVTAGSSATFAFTVTPTNHYDGTVTFSCGILPSLATCAFNPAAVTLNGTTAATVTLTISTTAASTASVIPHSDSGILLASIGGMGLFGLVFGLLAPSGPGRPRPGRRATLALLGIIVVSMLFWTACGGSVNNNNTSGKSQSSGTPAGTYTVTVTATGTAGTNNGNTLGHVVKLTLTVQ